jgi:hypothetical protein
VLDTKGVSRAQIRPPADWRVFIAMQPRLASAKERQKPILRVIFKLASGNSMSKEEPDIFGGKPETKSRQIAICFDTSALPSNISRHSDAKSGADLAAVITLIEGRASGKYQLLSSRLNDRELSETADPSQRAKLKTDYDALGKSSETNESSVSIQFMIGQEDLSASHLSLTFKTNKPATN